MVYNNRIKAAQCDNPRPTQTHEKISEKLGYIFLFPTLHVYISIYFFFVFFLTQLFGGLVVDLGS